MTTLVVGVDGGGTRTRVIVTDGKGVELASVTGSGSAVTPGQARRSADVIEALVREALAACEMADVTPGALCVGVAGVGRDAEYRAFLEAISGRSLVDLSFLAARHLTYYLPGHCISLQYVSVDELAMLFWAAVLTGREEIPPALREATATMRWREGLRARLSSSQKALLVHAVARVENGGGRVDVASWVKGVEYTANRLGLLLAGDPSRVVAMVTAEERRVGGLSANHRLTDLAVWGASEAHAKLRASLTQRI